MTNGAFIMCRLSQIIILSQRNNSVIGLFFTKGEKKQPGTIYTYIFLLLLRGANNGFIT